MNGAAIRSLICLGLVALASCGDPGFPSLNVGLVSSAEGFELVWHGCEGAEARKLVVGTGKDRWASPRWVIQLPENSNSLKIPLRRPEVVGASVVKGSVRELRALRPPLWVRVEREGGSVEASASFGRPPDGGYVIAERDYSDGIGSVQLSPAEFASRSRKFCKSL